jgi:hypothetical protein
MIGVFDKMAAVKCAEMMHAITPAEKKIQRRTRDYQVSIEV